MRKLRHQIVHEFDVGNVSPLELSFVCSHWAQQVISWLDTFVHSISIAHCHGG